MSFVERYARGQWLVATPADPEAVAVLSVRLSQRLSASAAFTRVGSPAHRESAPLSDAPGCVTAGREGGEGGAVATTGARGMDFRDATARRKRARRSDRRATDRASERALGPTVFLRGPDGRARWPTVDLRGPDGRARRPTVLLRWPDGQ